MPDACEKMEGNKREAEGDGGDADSAGKDDGGDKPLHGHFQGSRDHNQRIVGEDGEEHHNGEEYNTSMVKEAGCLLAILLAEKLDTDVIASESAQSIQHRTGQHNADKGNEKRLPRLADEGLKQKNECHGYSGDEAEQRGYDDL